MHDDIENRSIASLVLSSIFIFLRVRSVAKDVNKMIMDSTYSATFTDLLESQRKKILANIKDLKQDIADWKQRYGMDLNPDYGGIGMDTLELRDDEVMKKIIINPGKKGKGKSGKKGEGSPGKEGESKDEKILKLGAYYKTLDKHKELEKKKIKEKRAKLKNEKDEKKRKLKNKHSIKNQEPWRKKAKTWKVLLKNYESL